MAHPFVVSICPVLKCVYCLPARLLSLFEGVATLVGVEYF
ncbi:hypothetical protein EDB68_0201 [Vibrio crassostreae]|nr:hypothetical protein EDB68_0201 [Vibrio crassostreae]